MDSIALLGAERLLLKERFGVEKIGVFGSYARGEAQRESDIDVLVEFEPGAATYDNLFDLHQFLHTLLGRQVDVVTADGLSPHVRSYVEHEMVWA